MKFGKIALAFVIQIQEANCAAGYCPVMKCHESNAIIGSMEKYSCYEWASGTTIGSNMYFNVRKCPNAG